MFKGRVIFFIAEQIGPRHQGVTEGCVGQKGAMGYGVQHHREDKWRLGPDRRLSGQEKAGVLPTPADGRNKGTCSLVI